MYILVHTYSIKLKVNLRALLVWSYCPTRVQNSLWPQSAEPTVMHMVIVKERIIQYTSNFDWRLQAEPAYFRTDNCSVLTRHFPRKQMSVGWSQSQGVPSDTSTSMVTTSPVELETHVCLQRSLSAINNKHSTHFESCFSASVESRNPVYWK